MKKLILSLLTLFFAALIAAPGFAVEQTVAVYGETYMCGDAFTVTIVNQPMFSAQVVEKINLALKQINPRTGRYEEYQVAVEYAGQTEDEILLHIRLRLKNLNAQTLEGISKESFVLQGFVRDRIIDFLPTVMMPFVVKDIDWEVPLVSSNYYITSLPRPLSNSVIFNLMDYWNPLLMEEKSLASMHDAEIRLIYKVPNFLLGWQLRIRPQAAGTNAEAPRSCDLILRLPSIKDEIKNGTYQYTYY